MAQLKKNTFLAFAGLILATFALFALPATFDANLSVGDNYLTANADFPVSYEVGDDQQISNQPLNAPALDSNSPLQSALFWGVRRPFSQTSLRPQRGGLLYRILGRDGDLIKGASTLAIKCVPTVCVRHSGFPSPHSYRVPKDYYVFTLKRILC